MEKQESFNICKSADKAFLIESSNNFTNFTQIHSSSELGENLFDEIIKERNSRDSHKTAICLENHHIQSISPI
jgi:hypothetical protein